MPFMTVLVNIFCVAAGGSLGALTRYGLHHWCSQRWHLPGYVGILIANACGCFLLGFSVEDITTGLALASHSQFNALELFMRRQELQFLSSLILIGFCGSLTTFSSFSLDTVLLWRQNKKTDALLNLFVSLIVGLLLIWMGHRMATGWSSP